MRKVHLYALTELQSVQETPSQVIILIHGTFSRNASWTKQGSSFLNGISKRAPTDSLIFSFTWTGKNCARAREEAALRLLQHLMALAQRFPRVPHMIIGHSHGGNIALRAASKSSTGVKVVCLSTPIIYTVPRQRSEEKTARRVLWGIAVALLLPSFLYLASSRPNLGNGLVWAFSFTFAIACSLITFAGRRHLRWSLNLCELSAVTDGMNSASALFLRYPGDEASLALASFQAIQYLINRLVETATGIAVRLFNLKLVREWRGLLFPVLLLVGAASGLPLAYVVHHIFETGRPFSGTTLDIVAVVLPVTVLWSAGMIPLLAAVILVYAAGALFPLALLAGIIPFGWRLATASPWIELSVESAPIGDWNVVTLRPSNGMPKMRHALGYEEQEALEQIINFMPRSLIKDR